MEKNEAEDKEKINKFRGDSLLAQLGKAQARVLAGTGDMDFIIKEWRSKPELRKKYPTVDSYKRHLQMKAAENTYN